MRTMVWYRSTTGGRSWERTTVGNRSPLAHRAQTLRPGDIYDDGQGKLYRYRYEDAAEDEAS